MERAARSGLVKGRQNRGQSTPVIVFPWAFVCHDNHRLIPARNRKGLVASAAYRTKKKEAATLAALQWGPTPQLRGDLVLEAQCFFPDRRKRDAGNYRKMITDALTGTCYADDSALAREVWERVGYDKDNARIEIRLEAR